MRIVSRSFGVTPARLSAMSDDAPQSRRQEPALGGGPEILLEARRVVTFRPSQTLKEFLNDADAWRTGQ